MLGMQGQGGIPPQNWQQGQALAPPQGGGYNPLSPPGMQLGRQGPQLGSAFDPLESIEFLFPDDFALDLDEMLGAEPTEGLLAVGEIGGFEDIF